MAQTLLAIPSINPIPTSPITTHHHRSITLSSSLSSATSLTHLKEAHAQILRCGLETSPSLLLKLLFSSCTLSPNLHYALAVFAHITNPETEVCNRLLRELSRSFDPGMAIRVYQRMRRDGVGVDRFSFPPLLKALSRACALVQGLEVHGLAAKLGFDSDPFVETGLIGMYAACGQVGSARLVFDRMSHRDLVAWSIMIDGYSRNGFSDDALCLFEEMKSFGLEPDGMILSTILSASGRAGNIAYGKAVHEYITEKNLKMDTHLQSALVTMYASCGFMDKAQQLFDQMSRKNVVVSTAMVSGYARVKKIKSARLIFNRMVERDLVCWSAMISGYAESDWPQEALKLFNDMQVKGIKPDQVTLLSVISACAHLGALDKANWVHRYVNANGFGGALSINNALVDMYSKCGNLEKAREIFNRMSNKNVISWTSMINAFAIHGDASNALRFFYQMKAAKVEPSGVTFVGVLYACSHAGLVDEGREIFASMSNEYKITPKHEHYGCMVDLFGRANLFREALEIIKTMPLAPNVIIWGSLLAACRVHGHFKLGEFAARQLLELEPDHDGALVALSNIYAKERKWRDVSEVRSLMKRRGILKEKGCSRVELNNKIHEFLMADRSHPNTDEIYEKLDEVVGKLKLAGYAPDANSILLDLEDQEKRQLILWHSEKLALCCGLIHGEKGSCIRINKNLRICDDCHTFMKLASKVYEREIIVRDRTRFHHYKDGACSCKDYW